MSYKLLLIERMDDWVYALPGRKGDKQLHRLALANAEAEGEQRHFVFLNNLCKCQTVRGSYTALALFKNLNPIACLTELRILFVHMSTCA